MTADEITEEIVRINTALLRLGEIPDGQHKRDRKAKLIQERMRLRAELNLIEEGT